MEASFQLSLQTCFLMCSSAHCMVLYLHINIPFNQCQVIRAPSVIYLSDNSLISCYSSFFFVLYSHYGDHSFVFETCHWTIVIINNSLLSRKPTTSVFQLHFHSLKCLKTLLLTCYCLEFLTKRYCLYFQAIP